MVQPHRPTPEYLWPPSLTWNGPPELIYLDMNHWIGLAKAAVGHRDGDRYREALAMCRLAKRESHVIFSLSFVHYQELQKIKNLRQRAHVAAVMEELSAYFSILPREVVLRLEVNAYLNKHVGASNEPVNPLPLVGLGVGWAIGRRVDPKIVDSARNDVTWSTREDWPTGASAFDEIMLQMQMAVEREMLFGPAEGDIPELRRRGWKPESALQMVEDRAKAEREQALRLNLDPKWRRGRLRDVIASREIVVEILDPLNEGLRNRPSRSSGDILTSRDALRHFASCMPSTDVVIAPKTAAHKNTARKWESNDIYDIDALAVAIPYCDVVVTERHCAHVLTTDGIPGQTGTIVLTQIEDLVECLRSILGATFGRIA